MVRCQLIDADPTAARQVQFVIAYRSLLDNHIRDYAIYIQKHTVLVHAVLGECLYV